MRNECPDFLRAIESLCARGKENESAGERYVSELRRYLWIDANGAEKKTLQATRARLLLVSSLLSGAVLQSVRKSGKISQPKGRTAAPLLQVPQPKNEVGDFLIKAAESFCVNTAVDKAPIAFHNPSYFPDTGNKTTAIENVYIEADGGGKKRRFPTVYRNSSVILNARVLSSREVQTFVDRNPYCSTVILGSAKSKTDGVARLSADELMPESQTWETDVLKKMSDAFTAWAFQQYRANHKWASSWTAEAGQLMDVYGEKHTAIKQADRYHWTIRLVTLMALDGFLAEEESWSGNYDKQQRNVWLNILLPDCCPISEPDVPLEKRQMLTESDFPELFRQTVTQMLADPCRLPFIPRSDEKALCPRCDADDPEFRFYGYRRWFAPKGQPACAAIFFVRDEFCEWFSAVAQCACDPRAVLDFCQDTACPNYFAPQKKGARKARIPRALTDNKPVLSVILMLDQLDFLPDDKRQRLLQPFREEEK